MAFPFNTGDHVRGTLGKSVIEGVITRVANDLNYINLVIDGDEDSIYVSCLPWAWERIAEPLPTGFGAVIKYVDYGYFNCGAVHRGGDHWFAWQIRAPHDGVGFATDGLRDDIKDGQFTVLYAGEEN
jgi:hypothetical protein